MIAPSLVPDAFQKWNQRVGAPYGRRWPFGPWLRETRIGLAWRGPFGVQPNNTSRRFEYPWAFDRLRTLAESGTIVEIGGGVSGLQFILAKSGFQVINVDPGLQAEGKGWSVTPSDLERCSSVFGSRPTLINTTLDRAELADASADAVVVVSVLEHLTDEELRSVCAHIPRILKPGGVFVCTLDLFLNVHPFAAPVRNRYGRNVSVRHLLSECRLELAEGSRAELYGYDEFHPANVLAHLDEYLWSSYPVLTECFVGRKI